MSEAPTHRDWIVQLCERLGMPSSPQCEQAHRQHLSLLKTWNARAHLVSNADALGAGPLRHFEEALRALRHIPRSGTIVDLGSGGGFPGLVWASQIPDRRVILIEANARKAAFLRECSHRIGLGAVEVIEEHVADVERLVGLQPAVLTTRATGLNDLLLGAGERLKTTQKVVLVFFPAREDLDLGRRAVSLGFKSKIDLGLGDKRGRLLVLGSG